MALSDDQIWASDAIMEVNAAAGLPMPILGTLARAIEAEVRKQDEALIRQMLEALEEAHQLREDLQDRKTRTAIIKTARARLTPPKA